MKRSARQGMHENDMEAERVFKGAHCRTHLPTVTASCTYYVQPWVTFEAESSSLAVRLTQMAEYAFMKNVFFSSNHHTSL